MQTHLNSAGTNSQKQKRPRGVKRHQPQQQSKFEDDAGQFINLNLKVTTRPKLKNAIPVIDHKEISETRSMALFCIHREDSLNCKHYIWTLRFTKQNGAIACDLTALHPTEILKKLVSSREVRFNISFH